MFKKIYLNLALNNLKKNKRIYLPYFLISSFFIMMFYQMGYFATYDWSDSIGGIAELMTFGIVIIGIFSTIFMFYTNSFLMKQRKKEFGLFNILGMEKRHIGIMMFFENLLLLIGVLITGIVLGIVFSQLNMVFLQKILSFEVNMTFYISYSSIVTSIILFSIVYLLTLLSNLAKLHFSNPIELLRTKETGEKEPKSKVLLLLIGLVSISLAYYLALTVKYNMMALFQFFIAVILVIIATYCLFTYGSITILKSLRKNKRYYYKLQNFTSVSGMLYRMKKNAVGLANICILSCMVLVTVGTTTTMFVGTEETIDRNCPSDIVVNVRSASDDAIDLMINEVKTYVSMDEKAYNYRYVKYNVFKVLMNKEQQIVSYTDEKSSNDLLLITLDDFNRVTDNDYNIEENQILISALDVDNLNIDKPFEKDFGLKVKNNIEMPSELISRTAENSILLVVANENMKKTLADSLNIDLDTDYKKAFIGIETDNNDAVKIYEEINEKLHSIEKLNEEETYYFVSERSEMASMFYKVFGALFFIGLFLGSMFLMMTILIMYYKQITEGLMDKKRIQIMQQVGMTKKEVRKSINKQIRLVFFLPLITAFIHLAFAFKMISTVLRIMDITNIHVLLVSILSTSIIYAVIYVIVYKLTSNIYYKIVE